MKTSTISALATKDVIYIDTKETHCGVLEAVWMPFHLHLVRVLSLSDDFRKKWDTLDKFNKLLIQRETFLIQNKKDGISQQANISHTIKLISVLMHRQDGTFLTETEGEHNHPL